MKKNVITAVLLSMQLFSFSVFANGPAHEPSLQDKAWLKGQQQQLEEFKRSLQGQDFALPVEQQNQVAQFQSGIAKEMGTAERPAQARAEALYFVSFSIPKEGLTQMLSEARHFGIPATIRGLIDNDFRKTAGALFALSKERNDLGVQIDPDLFKQYNIKAVPALVVTCGNHYDVLSGNILIKTALQEIAREGDCRATARKLLGAEHE